MSEKTAHHLYLLDTSAWLALIENEEGAITVRGLIERAAVNELTLLTSFISYTEVRYISLQEAGEEVATERILLMEAMPIIRIESSRSLGIIAATIKARHRLSLADAWITAIAIENDAILVHKDPEYDQLGHLIKVSKLPYKSASFKNK